MNEQEFQIGQPVVEYATMRPSIISAVGVEYAAELVRVLDSESCEQLVTTGYGASLVIEDGECFPPPSEEFLTLVQQWLMSHPNV